MRGKSVKALNEGWSVGQHNVVQLILKLLLNGLLRQIFVRQDRYSGGHITGALQLPSLRSISQNLGKTLVLAVLPPVAALIMHLQFHGLFFKVDKVEVHWNSCYEKCVLCDV